MNSDLVLLDVLAKKATLSYDRYRQLLLAEAELNALKEAGVDNWESDAYDYFDRNEFDYLLP